MKIYSKPIIMIKNQIAQHKVEEKYKMPFSNSKKDIFKLIEIVSNQAKLEKSDPYVLQYLYILYTLVGRFER